MGGISGMMYKIPTNKYATLRLKVGNICQANSGQPCEELHGSVVTLKDDSQVMIVHAVDENKKSIIKDDTETIEAGGEKIDDYAQWKLDNVKPYEENYENTI